MHLRRKTRYGERLLTQTYQFVKSMFFGEEINATPPEEVSFATYKINYGRCLGHGTFGEVYEVSRRHDNEKGFLSSWFPYVYDYVYPTKDSNPSSSEYCVKIAKTSFRICLEYLHKPHKAIVYSLFSFFNYPLERDLHTKLHQHGLTQIEMIKTSGLYSQFKTVVLGKTFCFYAENDYFEREDQFKLRKTLVEFLRAIKKTPLRFYDVYSHNLMYDVKKNRWEIIDGFAREAKDASYSKKYFFEKLLGKANIGNKTKAILYKLDQLASNDQEYTPEIDKNILGVQTSELRQLKC